MAKVEKAKHHAVEFAARYSGTYFKTFGAASALYRTQLLLDDVEAMRAHRKECEKNGLSFGLRRETFEVIAYYSVGFITCLEWHGRSRLTDLLVYRPKCIKQSDADKITGAALTQMMGEEVTVPYLLGAATSVPSLKSYISIFQRVFDELGIDRKVEAILRQDQITYLAFEENKKDSLHFLIEELFRCRHELVHEIDMNIIGHHSIRDLWDADRPQRYGDAVMRCIQAMEGEITKFAPKDFPNRLDAEGYPEDENEKLAEEISELEKKIADALGDVKGSETAAAWSEALKASREAVEKEKAVIDSGWFFRPVRYLDFKSAIKTELLRRRRDYLKIIMEEATGHEIDAGRNVDL
jgi:hypothetical protein